MKSIDLFPLKYLHLEPYGDQGAASGDYKRPKLAGHPSLPQDKLGLGAQEISFGQAIMRVCSRDQRVILPMRFDIRLDTEIL